VFILGLSYFMAVLGTYLPDLGEVMRPVIRGMFFLTPIIYPVSSVPERFRAILSLNPVTPFFVAYQEALLYNRLVSWEAFGVMISQGLGGHVIVNASKNVFAPGAAFGAYSASKAGAHQLGMAEPHVRLQVYPHVLPSSDDVVEWTKGTSLTRFFKRLPAKLHDPFVDAYRDELRARIGHQQPYFYAFKRILLWGRRTG
jgi:hypothetical protein